MSDDKPNSHTSAERVSHSFARFFTTNCALYIALIVALVWIISWFGDRRWHDMLAEGVALISFLTIFTFQRSQNKDLKAIQIKLDELIGSSERASNRLIKAEEAPEHVLDQVHQMYREAAKAAIEEEDSCRSIGAAADAESLLEAHHADFPPSPLSANK